MKSLLPLILVCIIPLATFAEEEQFEALNQPSKEALSMLLSNPQIYQEFSELVNTVKKASVHKRSKKISLFKLEGEKITGDVVYPGATLEVTRTLVDAERFQYFKYDYKITPKE